MTLQVWKRDLEERKGLKAAEMRKEAERRRNMSALTARRKVLAEKRAATEAATKGKERLVLEEANSDWREVRDKQEAAKKARRRQSIMLNNSILERFKERAEALAQQEASQRQEDAQLKALDLAAVAEATARAATARRQSVMGRGLVQKMHKQKQVRAHRPHFHTLLLTHSLPLSPFPAPLPHESRTRTHRTRSVRRSWLTKSVCSIYAMHTGNRSRRTHRQPRGLPERASRTACKPTRYVSASCAPSIMPSSKTGHSAASSI